MFKPSVSHRTPQTHTHLYILISYPLQVGPPFWAGKALYEWLYWAWLWMMLLPPVVSVLLSSTKNTPRGQCIVENKNCLCVFSSRSCRTICSQRLFFTAPRSSMSSLKGSGFVGSSFFFSGRTTVSKSGSGWALNCGTWKISEETVINGSLYTEV